LLRRPDFQRTSFSKFIIVFIIPILQRLSRWVNYIKGQNIKAQ
jgi:hypothetical protein